MLLQIIEVGSVDTVLATGAWLVIRWGLNSFTKLIFRQRPPALRRACVWGKKKRVCERRDLNLELLAKTGGRLPKSRTFSGAQELPPWQEGGSGSYYNDNVLTSARPGSILLDRSKFNRIHCTVYFSSPPANNIPTFGSSIPLLPLAHLYSL
jgi:hypothetical protein